MNKWEIKKRNEKFRKRISHYKPQDFVMEAFKKQLNALNKQKIIAYADRKCSNDFNEVSKYGIHMGNEFIKDKSSAEEKFDFANKNYIDCKKSVMNSLIPNEVRLEKKFYDAQILNCFAKCEEVSQMLSDKKLEKCYKNCKFNTVNYESDKRLKVLEANFPEIEKLIIDNQKI